MARPADRRDQTIITICKFMGTTLGLLESLQRETPEHDQELAALDGAVQSLAVTMLHMHELSERRNILHATERQEEP